MHIPSHSPTSQTPPAKPLHERGQLRERPPPGPTDFPKQDVPIPGSGPSGASSLMMRALAEAMSPNVTARAISKYEAGKMLRPPRPCWSVSGRLSKSRWTS